MLLPKPIRPLTDRDKNKKNIVLTTRNPYEPQIY